MSEDILQRFAQTQYILSANRGVHQQSLSVSSVVTKSVCSILQWAWYIACFGSMGLGAVMFGALAYYARQRRILWIGLPAQDQHASADKYRPQAELYAPLLPGIKHMSHHR